MGKRRKRPRRLLVISGLAALGSGLTAIFVRRRRKPAGEATAPSEGEAETE